MVESTHIPLPQKGFFPLLSPAFSEIIKAYLGAVNGNLPCRPDTIRQCVSAACAFFYYAQTRGKGSLSEIQEEDCVSYFVDSSGKPRFGRGKACVLKQFLSSASSAYTECSRLVPLFPTPSKARKNIQYLTDEEAKAIEAECSPEGEKLLLAHKAVGMILLYTGMRGCDVNAIRLGDINWGAETITVVQRKTSEPVTIPMLPKVGNAIYDYITKERVRGSDALFTNSKGQPHFGKWVRANVVCAIYKAAGIRLGKGDRKGSHLFRHRLATKLLDANAPQPVISSILGHADPSSVEAYLSTGFAALRACALDVVGFPVDWEAIDGTRA